jgi:ATP-dependent Clp protease ATP-binding subunit ClpB
LQIDPSAEDLIAQEGYDPVYGARPLRRAIQGLIQNPLALQLLNGEIVAGETVRVQGDLAAGRMRFLKEEREGAAAVGEGNR